MKNKLCVLGSVGNKTAFLNVSPEEAVSRMRARYPGEWWLLTDVTVLGSDVRITLAPAHRAGRAPEEES